MLYPVAPLTEVVDGPQYAVVLGPPATTPPPADTLRAPQAVATPPGDARGSRRMRLLVASVPAPAYSEGGDSPATMVKGTPPPGAARTFCV